MHNQHSAANGAVTREQNLFVFKRTLSVGLLFCVLTAVEGIVFAGRGDQVLYAGIAAFAGAALCILTYVIMKDSRWFPAVTELLYKLGFLYCSVRLHDVRFYFFMMLVLEGTIAYSGNLFSLRLFIFASILIDLTLLLVGTSLLGSWMYDANGQIWLDSYTQVIEVVLFFVISCYIVSQTKRAIEKENKAEVARGAFLSLLRATPNMTVIADKDNKVRYLSSRLSEFAGAGTMDAAGGMPVLDLFRDISLKLVIADILDSGGYFEAIREMDIDGTPHYFKISADRLEGRFDGTFIDIIDITRTVESEHAAKDALEVAKSANESKSRFLATMSHEIRTPLNAILGIAEIESANAELPLETRTSIGKIFTSGTMLLDIINDLLDLSRVERGKMVLTPEEYDVASLINDTAQLNVVRVGSKRVEFIVEVTEDLPARLYGDELRVKQVLNNILSNAVKYTEAGSVTLSVSCHKARGGADEDVTLVISVRDTGIGMSEEQIMLIYDEYSRFNESAKKIVEGTGLGMSIVKNLVALMGGRVVIESRVGEGTNVRVMLTQKRVGLELLGMKTASNLMSMRFREAPGVGGAPFEKTPMPYGTALVVDDMEMNLFVARGMLSPYKIAVETATSGAEAIGLVRAGGVYDVIFMDHMMPRMDGVTCVEILRENGYTKPIVALTANAVKGIEELFESHGFNGFVAKPINARKLDECLRKYVMRDIIEQAPQNKETDEDESFTRLVRAAFVRDAKRIMPTIAAAISGIGFLEGESLKDFTVSVHALKSSLANLGEDELSLTAASLEAAGLANDKPLIASGGPKLLAELRRVVDAIVDEQGEANTEPIAATARRAGRSSPAQLILILRDIIEAANKNDHGKTMAAVDDLTGAELEPWQRDIADEIGYFALHKDYLCVGDRAVEMLEKL